jgi:hypothetical protein
MLVVRVTENVRAVQSSYYSNCPWSALSSKVDLSPVQSQYETDKKHDVRFWPKPDLQLKRAEAAGSLNTNLISVFAVYSRAY